MVETREKQIRDNLKRLAAIHAATMSVLEESVELLQAELDSLSHKKQRVQDSKRSVADSNEPIVDRCLMCVVYRGKQCFLGNTLMLKFLERLIRRPNQYISYDALLSDVWNAVREPSTVRSVVKELRAKLRAAGMSEISDAIDGHVSGHYGLILNNTK